MGESKFQYSDKLIELYWMCITCKQNNKWMNINLNIGTNFEIVLY